MDGGTKHLGRDPLRPAGRTSTAVFHPADVELSIRALRAWTEFAAEDPAEANLRPTPEDAEVDQVMVEFGGDFRSAISALLHDLAVLAGDFTACVSRGYVKGRRPEKHRPHARETRLEERA